MHYKSERAPQTHPKPCRQEISTLAVILQTKLNRIKKKKKKQLDKGRRTQSFSLTKHSGVSMFPAAEPCLEKAFPRPAVLAAQCYLLDIICSMLFSQFNSQEKQSKPRTRGEKIRRSKSGKSQDLRERFKCLLDATVFFFFFLTFLFFPPLKCREGLPLTN